MADTDPPENDARERQPRTSMADGKLRESVELQAFLDGVGDLLRLPPKPPEPSAAAPAKSADAARRAPVRPRQTALLLVFCAVAGGAVLARALQPKAVTTLPAELVGVWRTDAPRYADRRLEITTSSVGFQAGAGAAPAPLHRILQVLRSAGPEGVRFRIEYLQEDARAELDIVWQDWPRPSIRFSNQSDLVWTREEPAGPPAPPGRPAS